MTANEMPLILDNPMDAAAMQVDLGDVDDLFGDGGTLTLPSRPPPSKRLYQRLDELRSRGCCQSLAWSKAGTIASISADGQSLELRYLRAHPKDATWALSEPTTISPWSNLAGGPIVHLSWAPTVASELAVVDAVGRVQILNFATNMNRPGPIFPRKWDGDTVDDLQTIVGTYWLNTLPNNKNMVSMLHVPAVKDGNNYNYEVSYVLSNGPYHPNPARSSLVCVTTNGVLKLFWYQNSGQMFEATLELESITSSDELITHAAICSERGKSLLIALATSSKQLRIVQVALNWGVPKEVPPNIPPQSIPLNPTMKERHITVSSWFQGSATESPYDTSMTQLSHLEILPQMLDTVAKSWLHPVVLGARSFVPAPNSPYSQDVQSIVDRWEINIEQSQTLHPAFEQLGSRRNSVGNQSSPTANRLKKLEPLIFDKVITGIHVLHLGKIICFSFSDGTVEYRDRMTWNEIYNEVNLDRLNAIHDAGFAQPGEPSSVQTALSPTNCSLVQMCDDGAIKWHPIQYTLADPSTISDVQLQAVIAGVTMTTAQAVVYQSNIDDVLAVARNFICKEQFAFLWAAEMVRAIKIPVDYTEESHHDSLVRNNHLQLCFSTLNHLGWKGEFQPRHVRTKLSMLALNLRNIVILITIASNNHIRRDSSSVPLDEPEVVEALAGCCKWSIDLLCWITDSLFCLLDDTKFMGLLNQARFSEMTPYLISKGEIALHMVLSSSTRGLLSAICRRIDVLESLSLRTLKHYETRSAADRNGGQDAQGHPVHGPGGQALQQAYQRVHKYTSSALIQVKAFDSLLASLGSDIRETYSRAFATLAERAAKAAAQNPNAPKPPGNPGEEAVKRAQTHCELTLMLVAPPPPPFLALIAKFFNKDLPAFRNQTDPAKLFFADFSILEVDDGPRALAARRAKGARVDLFQRIELFPGRGAAGAGAVAAGKDATVPWRRCARCASVMEDLSSVSTKPGINFVLSQQRNCSCAGRLAILAKDQMVG